MDLTAGLALKNVEKTEKERREQIMRDSKQNIKRGDIFYIEYFENTVGSEQRPGRPAIIVSNDRNNQTSATVEIVYLTTQPKMDMPTHVDVNGTGKTSTAICEQVTTISVERLGDYCGACTLDEMKRLDRALLHSLGITPAAVTECDPEQEKQAVSEIERECIATKAKLDTMEAMYANLLQRFLDR